MREQLVQYVNLLFAGAPDSEDIRAEILQNTLDRYDDLVAQGKSPEAAYRLAITGIGDINEILGKSSTPAQNQSFKEAIHEEVDEIQRRKMRSIAIAMYILCPIPLFILGDIGVGTLGLCLTIALVATATYIIVNYGKSDPEDSTETVSVHPRKEDKNAPQSDLKKSVASFVWAIGLAFYFILSFSTGSWYITWLLFPITGCIEGLAKAILDLREANRNEN